MLDKSIDAVKGLVEACKGIDGLAASPDDRRRTGGPSADPFSDSPRHSDSRPCARA